MSERSQAQAAQARAIAATIRSSGTKAPEPGSGS